MTPTTRPPSPLQGRAGAAKQALATLTAAGLIVLALLILTPSPTFAATGWYVATSGNDSGDCLSPQSPCATVMGVFAKSGFSAGDAIRVAQGTYTGVGAQVVTIQESVSLLGGWDDSFSAQTGRSTLDGAGARRGITIIGPATVLVDHFTIQNGQDPAGGGGAIYKQDADLTLSNSTLSNNKSSYPDGTALGGGILNNGGDLTVLTSTITHNTGDFGGGGIFNLRGDVTVEESTIDGNTAGKAGFSGGGGGAGIEQDSGDNGSLTVIASMISNNQLLGDYDGSAIAALGPLTLINSTVFRNIGAEAIYVFQWPASLIATTIAQNFWYGILNRAGTVTLENSILALSATYDCANDDPYGGTVTSLGHNLVQNNGNCPLTSSDLTGVDPRLSAPANNGGPTPTMALRSGSPAIDAIPAGANGCGTTLTHDQRGQPRPQGGGCDIGAYESTPPTAAHLTIFTARRTRAGVLLRWNSLPPDTIAGYNLYRTSGTHPVKLNARLIPGRSTSSRAQHYSWLDPTPPTGGRVSYRLQTVDISGKQSWCASTTATRPPAHPSDRR
jgi:hypothetical protein